MLKLFRSLGFGYGPRMNTLLRAFMSARLAGMLESPDMRDCRRERWTGKETPPPVGSHAERERRNMAWRRER